MRVHKGDTVQVISGKDKGARGKVLAAYPREQRVLVEGVNRITKHTKVGQTARGTKTGGIITQEATVHVSNVMLVDPETNKPTRVGYRRDDEGRKVRVAKRTGKDLS
jgi:large subunit ribosomal protein L24